MISCTKIYITVEVIPHIITLMLSVTENLIKLYESTCADAAED